MNLKKEREREALRGLFVFGLLAVLVTVRFQNEELMVTIGESSFDFIPFINFTILLWSFYAFFIIVGLSDDVIGKTTAETFWYYSKVFLQIDFIWSAIIGTFFFILGYPSRSKWILMLAGASIFFVVMFSIGEIFKVLKEKWKAIRSTTTLDKLVMISLMSFLISLVALFFCDEQYLFAFVCSGVVSFFTFYSVKYKQYKSKLASKK
jgi:hypothetical protein